MFPLFSSLVVVANAPIPVLRLPRHLWADAPEWTLLLLALEETRLFQGPLAANGPLPEAIQKEIFPTRAF